MREFSHKFCPSENDAINSEWRGCPPKIWIQFVNRVYQNKKDYSRSAKFWRTVRSWCTRQFQPKSALSVWVHKSEFIHDFSRRVGWLITCTERARLTSTSAHAGRIGVRRRRSWWMILCTLLEMCFSKHILFLFT